jgi:acetylornithine/succinyldiaminopimelate/putrescine aminotransferase
MGNPNPSSSEASAPISIAENSHPDALRIARAKNATLVDEQGKEYVDLHSGFGAAWLGHANPEVGERIAEQLQQVWLTGTLETSVVVQARSALDACVPPSHRTVVLYSTGMEAAELAIRIARATTGRNELVGFAGGMHGKSLATAHLGWDNRDGLDLPLIHRLPFVDAEQESDILARLDRLLAAGTIAAVFVEPIQASARGHRASPGFYRSLSERCRASRTLLVFDEILTGFGRTGPWFFFSDLGFTPDVVLVGKAMGGGFPVSAVVVHRDIAIEPRTLPSSTYSNNPLAAAAVTATLELMRTIDLPARVAEIESIVKRELQPMTHGPQLRGQGALWIVELPAGVETAAVARRLLDRGVAVSFSGRIIRLLPAVTIELDRLAEACQAVAEELGRACREAAGRPPTESC